MIRSIFTRSGLVYPTARQPQEQTRRTSAEMGFMREGELELNINQKIKLFGFNHNKCIATKWIEHNIGTKIKKKDLVILCQFFSHTLGIPYGREYYRTKLHSSYWLDNNMCQIEQMFSQDSVFVNVSFMDRISTIQLSNPCLFRSRTITIDKEFDFQFYFDTFSPFEE